MLPGGDKEAASDAAFVVVSGHRAGNVVRRQALPSIEAAKQGKQQCLISLIA